MWDTSSVDLRRVFRCVPTTILAEISFIYFYVRIYSSLICCFYVYIRVQIYSNLLGYLFEQQSVGNQWVSDKMSKVSASTFFTE